jgi:lipopolysaccharide biosynthesis protein WzzE
MMTQPLAGAKSVVTLRMSWIFGVCFAPYGQETLDCGDRAGVCVVALAYTFFAKQEWSATAITDRPTVNMLGVLFPAAIPA